MGFCLFNNVAVAARHALDAHGVERVLILDWDVHHGNGTNDIFHARSARAVRLDPRVAALSGHRRRRATSARGRARAARSTCRCPAGSGDATSGARSSSTSLVPLGRAYAPELVLVSAGFDAHARRPARGLRGHRGGLRGDGRPRAGACAEALGAPLGLVLEGGYDLGALARSLVARWPCSPRRGPAAPAGRRPIPHARAALERLRAVVARARLGLGGLGRRGLGGRRGAGRRPTGPGRS